MTLSPTLGFYAFCFLVLPISLFFSPSDAKGGVGGGGSRGSKNSKRDRQISNNDTAHGKFTFMIYREKQIDLILPPMQKRYAKQFQQFIDSPSSSVVEIGGLKYYRGPSNDTTNTIWEEQFNVSLCLLFSLLNLQFYYCKQPIVEATEINFW